MKDAQKLDNPILYKVCLLSAYLGFCTKPFTYWDFK